MPKCRSSIANSRTKVAVLLGMNRCGSFPLISAPHILFRILTNFKRSDNIPRAPAWNWGERIWLTGPFGLHRNLLLVLNISSSGFLRGAMGEISNFYNFSRRLLIFGTHIPSIMSTHTSKFQSCVSDTFWIMIFFFLEIGAYFQNLSPCTNLKCMI